MAASAIDLVVHQARVAGGRRRVAAISEVALGARGELDVHPLMSLDASGEEIWSAPSATRVAEVMAAMQ